MAVSAQCEVRVVSGGELIQNIGRVREDKGETTRLRRWNAAEVRAVERRIVKADDGQFAAFHRKECDLVEQQRDLAAIELLGKFVHSDAAVVVVVPEGDEDRGQSP